MINNTIKLLENGTLAVFKTNALNRAKEFSVENVLPQYEAAYQKALT